MPHPSACSRAIGAALASTCRRTPQSVELKEKLATLSPEEFVTEVTGLSAEHPLFPQVLAVVRG